MPDEETCVPSSLLLNLLLARRVAPASQIGLGNLRLWWWDQWDELSNFWVAYNCRHGAGVIFKIHLGLPLQLEHSHNILGHGYWQLDQVPSITEQGVSTAINSKWTVTNVQLSLASLTIHMTHQDVTSGWLRSPSWAKNPIPYHHSYYFPGKVVSSRCWDWQQRLHNITLFNLRTAKCGDPDGVRCNNSEEKATFAICIHSSRVFRNVLHVDFNRAPISIPFCEITRWQDTLFATNA